MLSDHPYYVGEGHLNHYRLGQNGERGFRKAPMSIPKDPNNCEAEYWYAVTHGWDIGIYSSW